MRVDFLEFLIISRIGFIASLSDILFSLVGKVTDTPGDRSIELSDPIGC